MGVFLPILGVALVEFIGDASLKMYSRNGGTSYLATGISSYLFMVWFLIHILKQTNVTYMNLQWDTLSMVVETVLAFFLLGERLSNNAQYTGAVMMILGSFLLNYGKVPV